ncbi:MAG: hypothetical protein Q4G51_15425, partial [Dermatophilus congolensis]|nr:hypothetical protein [Dermatophilus congolensis]
MRTRFSCVGVVGDRLAVPWHFCWEVPWHMSLHISPTGSSATARGTGCGVVWTYQMRTRFSCVGVVGDRLAVPWHFCWEVPWHMSLHISPTGSSAT